MSRATGSSAISDHADPSQPGVDHRVTPERFASKMEHYRNITIIPGIEITHAPKSLIGELIAGGQEARRCLRGGPRRNPRRTRGRGDKP